MKWERGKNPYLHNYFGKLFIGPNATPPQIVSQARKLVQKRKAGKVVELAGEELDDHAINESSAKLRDPRSLAEELLLVHPQPQREDKKKMKLLLDRLCKTAVVSEGRYPVPLVHPMAIFWFIPSPGPETAKMPEWDAFGLVEAGNSQDLQLDIVFDS